MNATRLAPLGLIVTLAAVGCGQSRGTVVDLGTVTLPGGAADGSDVTVRAEFCVACHGDAARAPAAGDAAGVAFAPPVDVSRAAASDKVGAHMAHLRSGPLRDTGVPCASCHVVPRNAGQHTPGVQFRGLASTVWAGAPVIAPAYDGATCTNTYCHGAFPGGKAAAIAWNSTASLGCASCHALPPPLPHPSATDCGTCHPGYALGTVDPTTHIDGAITGGCTGCHGDPTRANGGIVGVSYDRFQTAAPPPPSSAYDASTVVVGAHLAHVNPTPSVAGASQPTGGVYKPIACTECHPNNSGAVTHPNGTLTVTFAAATGADLGTPAFVPTFSQGNGQTTATTCNTYCHDGVGGGSVATWSWTGAAATCGSCHGFPPASHTGVAAAATACNGCHDKTVKPDGTIDVAGGFHINGTVEGGESAGGLACGDCHASIVAAMTGAAASKHSLALDTPADDAAAWTGASLSTSVAVGARSCVNMCHGDHPHTLTSPAVSTHENNVYLDASTQGSRAAGTRTSATRAKTDFLVGETKGGLCTSCHLNAITAGGPTLTVAKYGGSAHDFDTFGAWAWNFALHDGSAFNRNCTKCHASATEGRTPAVSSVPVSGVHSGANPSLLAGVASPINGAGMVCYNCHGSAAPIAGQQGNRSGKNIQAQFAKANAHDPAGSCLDCHDPHQAQAGTHATPGNKAGPPLQGVPGARLQTNPAFWTAPTAGAFNAVTIAAGTEAEATLCFKCHSAFATALPAGTTDVAKEFNPNNTGNFAGTWAAGETAGGFHPVLASAGSNLGAVRLANLSAPWNAARNLMTCTDCHESNSTTDPNGPHGSTAAFILKGPNVAWNTASVATSSGMPGGVFCRNCHSATWASSRFQGGPGGSTDNHYQRSAHRVACMNCHAAIPHGGPRPGMLIAPAGKSANVPTHAGWDTGAPYSTPGTGSTLYIVSYPTNNTTDWDQNDCGCNGTGH